MHFSTATALSVLALASSVFAGPLGQNRRDNGDDNNSDINIFPSADHYDDWAICKGKVTKNQFPQLQAPSHDGGCVRYFQGIDITGVVTMVNLYHKDGINSACDCASACLERPETCTNWVFKHTFAGAAIDDNKRSCTLYSSPNLPLGVTLDYNLNQSVGFGVVGMNAQQGCDAPQTFLDVNSTMPDKFGVSGFAVRDTLQRQYC
jgi:hypothetical protein